MGQRAWIILHIRDNKVKIVNSKMLNQVESISEEIVLPSVQELFINDRNGEFLILNPLGPWWFIGSELHADFVQLCDGKRSVRDIFDLLSPRYGLIKIEHLIQVAGSLMQQQFFAETEKLPIRPLGVVHFYITRRCNLNCPFCFYDSIPSMSKEGDKELDSEFWIRLADEIAEINPEAMISISGGEPLIRTDAIDIIERISQTGLKTRLVTNGTLFTEDLVSRLSKISKLRVQVSIDSLVPEENARTRGQGSMEKAVEAVQWMVEAGVNVAISSTVTQINKKSIWRLKQFCDRNNISLGTSFFFASGDRSKINAPWLELKPSEVLESSADNAKHYDYYDVADQSLMPTPGMRRCHCGIGYGQVAIQPDGSVSPCRLLTDSRFFLGNVKKSELRELLNIGHMKYNFLEVDKVTCDCAKCHVRYLCIGGCKAISFYNYGNLDRCPPNCELLKQIYTESLWASILGPSYRPLEDIIHSSPGSARKYNAK
jgi:radical SAM protein with 4Fe4S-binding SPASM domain